MKAFEHGNRSYDSNIRPAFSAFHHFFQPKERDNNTGIQNNSIIRSALGNSLVEQSGDAGIFIFSNDP